MANKKITELQLVDAITDDLNFPVDDTLQTYRATIGQVKTYLAPIYCPPSFQSILSGTGTFNKHFTFICGTASATVGATYTNNAITYTVVRTIASGTQIVLSGSAAPTASGTLTKASGTGDATITFSLVKAPIAYEVEMVGGGSGGRGGGTSVGAAAGSGGNTTFGSSFLTANGGTDSTPGSATIATPAFGIALSGGFGGATKEYSSSAGHPTGSMGASTPYGGAGAGVPLSTGTNAIANTGSGGGGGGGNVAAGTVYGGKGGEAGGWLRALINFPSDTYAYAVGAAGTAGAAGGGSGNAGGTGGSGVIHVKCIYQ